MALFKSNWVTQCRKVIKQPDYNKHRYDQFKDESEFAKTFCNGIPKPSDGEELYREYRYFTANMLWYRKRLRNQ